MSARERRAKTRKRQNTAVRRITGSTAVVATATLGLAGPILSAAEAAVGSATATQLDNINTITAGSYPSNLTDVSGTLYYTADAVANGTELWKSTGTNGTQVADLIPGAQGSYPTDLTNANGHLFFFAANAAGAEQLWTSNGTAAGTTQLTNVSGGVYAENMVNVGNNVSFLVATDPNDTQLWTSNGTVNGTNHAVVANVINATDLATDGTDLYFAASGNNAGTQADQYLWASNGSAANTVEVKPGGLMPKTNGAYDSVHDLTNVNGTLYFAANGANGAATSDQVYDVTAATALTNASDTVVTNFANGTAVTNLASNGADVFFETQNTGGAGLWDGTVGALGNASDANLTSLVLSNTNSLIAPDLTNVNGEMYFVAETNAGATALWHSNGAANGTNAVTNAPTNVGSLTNVNNALYFEAGNGNGGVWTSNGGTVANSTLEVNNSANLTNATYLADSGSTLYFSAGNASSGSHLWAGTAVNGVKELDGNVDAADNAGSYPTDFTPVGANTFFAATSANGPGLWLSNGLTAGTGAVMNGLTATDLVNVGGQLAFVGNTPSNTTPDIWFSGGTAGTTAASTGNIGVKPTDLANVNGTLYFEANGVGTANANQVQIWEANATGATEVTNFTNQYVGPNESTQIVNVGSEAYFVVNADGPAQLWESNGINAGTVEVNGAAAPSENYITNLTPVGSELYYVTESSTGEGLWVTNGTATTELVSGANFYEPTNVNGALFFSEKTSSGYALWTTNGAVAGTRAVKTGIEPEAMVGDGGELYFATYTAATNSTGLWESNGSATGTTSFTNITGELPYGGYLGMTNANGALAFAFNDGTHGTELWTSNGTAAGTGLVDDVWNGTQSGLSFPDITNDGSTVFFAADDGQDGVEPWVATNLSAAVPPVTTTTTTTTTSTTPTTPVTTTTKSTTTPTITTPKPVVKPPSVGRLGSVKTSGGTLTLALTCTAGSGNCVATGKVEIVETIKNKKVVGLSAIAAPSKTKTTKKTIILVSKRATIKAGKSGTLKLTLNAAGQKLLVAHKKLKVELLVTEGTRTISKKTVTLTAPKPKKKTTK